MQLHIELACADDVHLPLSEVETYDGVQGVADWLVDLENAG